MFLVGPWDNRTRSKTPGIFQKRPNSEDLREVSFSDIESHSSTVCARIASFPGCEVDRLPGTCV